MLENPYEKLMGRKLTLQEEGEVIDSLVGFFNVLMEMERNQINNEDQNN